MQLKKSKISKKTFLNFITLRGFLVIPLLGGSDRGYFWKIIVCIEVFGDFICAEHTSEQGFSSSLQELLPKNF